MKIKFVFLFIFFVLNLSAQKKSFDLVKDFGAKANAQFDVYESLQKAAAAISKAGGGKLNIPKGTYYIKRNIDLSGKSLLPAEDVKFMNCSNLTIEGNNSTFIIKGDFKRKRDYQLPNLGFWYSYNNSVCPFVFSNCKNLIFRNITLDGQVNKMTKDEGVVEGNSYGVKIEDHDENQISSKVLIENVRAHHFAADGFLINVNGSFITMNKCVAQHNARQGLSIVKGSDIMIKYCTFDSTGFTQGTYGWHMPSAGIDVENEFGEGKLDRVTIKHCNIRGNRKFQIVSTLPSRYVWVDSCFFADAAKGYGDGLNGIGMYSKHSKFTNNLLYGEIQVDLADQIYTGPPEQVFSGNVILSGNRGITSSDFGRPFLCKNNLFIMLPKPNAYNYFPYIQNGNGTFENNILFLHTDKVKAETNLVTSLLQLIKKSRSNFWLLYGDTAYAKKTGNYYYVAYTNAKEVGNDYSFENGSYASRGYTKENFVKPENDKLLRALISETIVKKGFTVASALALKQRLDKILELKNVQ